MHLPQNGVIVYFPLGSNSMNSSSHCPEGPGVRGIEWNHAHSNDQSIEMG